MGTSDTVVCCPKFNAEPWDEKTLTWENRRFVKDRIRSFFHIPLNFASVVKRNVAAIEAASAKPQAMLMLTDENSLWGADVYFEVTKDVPNAQMATISGTFLSKVFEGPFRNIPKWIETMNGFAKAKGKAIQQLYFYYTTCPKCAKKYGANYVVLLGQV